MLQFLLLSLVLKLDDMSACFLPLDYPERSTVLNFWHQLS